MNSAFEDRYARQSRLPQVGEDGQSRLAAGRVLLAGSGALGSVIAETLVRAGVGQSKFGGRVVLVDRDVVEPTNLQRQSLFDELDAEEGLPKAVAAQRRLREINRDVEVVAHAVDLNAGNVESLAGVHDPSSRVHVLLDGLDNFETRYLLNDVAVKHGLPYVYGGAVGTAGTAMVVLPHTSGPDTPQAQRDSPWEKLGLATPDLRDLQETLPPAGSTDTCDTAGVLGPTIQTVAAWQAAEAMKVLLGDWASVHRGLWSVDLWANRSRTVDVSGVYDASVGVCSKQRRFEFLERASAGGAVQMCGRHAVQVAPATPTTVDFRALTQRWAGVVGEVKAAPFMAKASLTGEHECVTLTVFEDGRTLVQGTDDPTLARTLVARYVGV